VQGKHGTRVAKRLEVHLTPVAEELPAQHQPKHDRTSPPSGLGWPGS
jgi:hypothetical protein